MGHRAFVLEEARALLEGSAYPSPSASIPPPLFPKSLFRKAFTLLQGWKVSLCAPPVAQALTQPPAAVRKMEAQLEYVHVACTFFARSAPIRILGRCLLVNFLRRSSVGSLLRVRCWLGWGGAGRAHYVC